jgi:hypothetical protein
MTETRRLKLKIGEAEFEADVPENEVQPMYCQFLSMLERRGQTAVRLSGGADDFPRAKSGDREPSIVSTVRAGSSAEFLGETFDKSPLTRIFDVRQDGAVTLKVLPSGPDKNADAMLLLLYGYYRLKNEEYVLATHLFRSADQSGISLRRPVKEYAGNAPFVVRGGQRKGSHYSLNQQGRVKAQEISTRILAASVAGTSISNERPAIRSWLAPRWFARPA